MELENMRNAQNQMHNLFCSNNPQNFSESSLVDKFNLKIVKQRSPNPNPWNFDTRPKKRSIPNPDCFSNKKPLKPQNWEHDKKIARRKTEKKLRDLNSLSWV